MTLQLYLHLGMRIIKIHRVVSFKQGDYLKSWVDFCTKKRSESKDSFSRDFWKLMVNAVYGKTIECLANRVNVKICRTKEELLQAVSKKTYKSQVIINNEMVIVTMRKPVVYYNTPYYIGFSVLDISKFIMYQYYYKVLRQYYKNYKQLQLLYSDTDSFILKIKTNDLIHDLKRLSHTFDFSNLPKNHLLFDDSKRSKLFHFKEEFGLLPILRVIALGSKVYSIQSVCCHEFKSHSEIGHTKDKIIMKGVSKTAQKCFTFDDYFLCLQKQIMMRALEYRILSKKQQISSTLVQKVAVSGFDDKRFILECGIHSRPYNYKNSDKCYAEECVQ